MVRVLIVDDSQLVRLGLQSLVEMQGDLEWCGSADSGRAGVEMAIETRPDVVLMDLSMPDVDGIEATRQILDSSPRSGVIMLTGHSTPSWEKAAMAAGVKRYLLKGTPPDALLDAIRAVGGARGNQLALD